MSIIQDIEVIASTVVSDGFKAAIAELPVLESILSTLAAELGSTNINWAGLLTVILTALPGGPVAVILAILTSLSTILVHPSTTAIAAAKLLLALHAQHAI